MGREDQPASPWLHEEVARRMEDRLQWMLKHPRSWLHWQVLRGGIEAHALLRRRYPAAASFVQQEPPQALALARAALRPPWWSAQRWRNPTRFTPARAGLPRPMHLPICTIGAICWCRLVLQSR